ncbi:MAG TPA: DUF6798 domain-containing protein, partial [Bryobacteraceae bacterium]|nr:DUF6798 domain-containing protein [Bryobacteraceae bacterium]
FEQIAARALGIWGLYLMAVAMGLSVGPAAMVAAICSLGATILGPAVLTWEYEPTPRAFAVPLLICGMGLAAHRRYLAAGVAGAVAFLYHPPTTVPFWVAFVVVLVVRRRPAGLVPLAAAGAVLAVAAWSSPGGFGSSAGGLAAGDLFARLTPLQEQLQRMRTPYVWISAWPAGLIPHYLILSGILLAAFARIRREIPRELGIFLVGLPAIGLASMPLSRLLLEHWRWALVPQIQPMRALLFVALSLEFLTSAAGVFATNRQRLWEALGWFALAYLLPLDSVITAPLPLRRAALVLVLAALTVLASRIDWRLAPAAAVAAFFAIPLVGGVVNYPRLHTAELAQLSEWARSSTPQDSVFLFPDAGHALYPGIFRSEALRAVYIDWKGGGQVNYLRDFGEQWWFRWQQTMANGFRPADLSKYGGLGIAYVVLQEQNRLPGPPAFKNSKYVAYAVP